MNNIKKADKSGTIIGDSNAPTVMDKFIHTSWTKSCLDNLNDSLASVDVWLNLSFSGRLFGSFLHDDDLWLLLEHKRLKIYNLKNLQVNGSFFRAKIQKILKFFVK